VNENEARERLRVLRSAYKNGPERYDVEVLKREPSTVRRWLRGAPIPQVIIAYLNNVRRATALDSDGASQNIEPLPEAGHK